MSGRFQIAIHILTLLQYSDKEVLSSDYIAGSINANPALVRAAIGNLRKNGLIDSKEGKNGGYTLAKSADKILLDEVYKAMGDTDIMGKARNVPNPDCPVGKDISKHIHQLYDSLDEVLLRKLSTISIADFTKQFK